MEQTEQSRMYRYRYIPIHVAMCECCGFVFKCSCIDHLHARGRVTMKCPGCIHDLVNMHVRFETETLHDSMTTEELEKWFVKVAGYNMQFGKFANPEFRTPKKELI